MAKISDVSLIGALRDAGIADSNTRRVVIDIRAGHIPVVYVERFGDQELVQVIEAMSSVDVTVKQSGLTDTEREVDRQAALARSGGSMPPLNLGADEVPVKLSDGCQAQG